MYPNTPYIYSITDRSSKISPTHHQTLAAAASTIRFALRAGRLPPPISTALSPPPQFQIATAQPLATSAASTRLVMYPRHHVQSASGFCGVHLRPSGKYGADITCGGQRVWLGTFEPPQEIPRAFDAVACRFGRPRKDMNFPEIESRA